MVSKHPRNVNKTGRAYLMFANSLLMRFSSNSLALAFLKSAMNVTSPDSVGQHRTARNQQLCNLLTAHRLGAISRPTSIEEAARRAAGGQADRIFGHLETLQTVSYRHMNEVISLVSPMCVGYCRWREAEVMVGSGFGGADE
jgi:hypothetical protein